MKNFDALIIKAIKDCNLEKINELIGKQGEENKPSEFVPKILGSEALNLDEKSFLMNSILLKGISVIVDNLECLEKNQLKLIDVLSKYIGNETLH